jgi:CheY-like chemotaxis protein
MDDYITKPIRPEALTDIVARWTGPRVASAATGKAGRDAVQTVV